MMLDHPLGDPDVAAAVIGAIKAVLEDSDLRTPDHGGVAGNGRYDRGDQERTCP